MAALAAILLWLGNERPAEPPAAPSVELRLVEAQGAGPATSPPPAAAPAKPAVPVKAIQAPAAETQPTTPPPTIEQAEPAPEPLPLPPPRAPPPHAIQAASSPKPAPAAPPHPPEMNLSGGNSLSNAMASGPAVLPARVDAHWHNNEPVYPVSAARRGEEGAVLLLIHVGPDGAVTGLDVEQSSGFLLLDRAAREAVAAWHFLPAVRNGAPVASEMPLRVEFQLN